MEIIVARGTFRLKGATLKQMAKRAGIDNKHQLSMKAGISYPSSVTWMTEPEKLESIHLPSLAGILIDAFGMTPSQALDLRLGDLFEYVPDEGVGAE